MTGPIKTHLIEGCDNRTVNGNDAVDDVKLVVKFGEIINLFVGKGEYDDETDAKDFDEVWPCIF